MGTVGGLVRGIDARLTTMAGLTRLAHVGLPLDGSATTAAAQGYYDSGLWDPGDIDGDGKDDIMFYGLARDGFLTLRFQRGSDGQELWSLREPSSASTTPCHVA